MINGRKMILYLSKEKNLSDYLSNYVCNNENLGNYTNNRIIVVNKDADNTKCVSLYKFHEFV